MTDILFSKDATYSGIKQFDATVTDWDGDWFARPKLVIRQAARGAKLWNVVYETILGDGRTYRVLLDIRLDRRAAKQRAADVLARWEMAYPKLAAAVQAQRERRI